MNPYAPSRIDPAELVSMFLFALPTDENPWGESYEEARAIYAEQGAKIHGGTGQCDVCGAVFKLGALFRHEPTGDVLAVGWQCAENLELGIDHAEQGRMRKRGADFLERRKIGRRRRAALRDWLASEQATPELRAALRCPTAPVPDIRWRLTRYGSISDRQAELAIRLARELRETPSKAPVPIAAEPLDIAGRVLSARWEDDRFGGGGLKMLVEVQSHAAAGGAYRLWGTVPESISRALEQREQANRDRFHLELDAWREGGKLGEAPIRPEPLKLPGHAVQFRARVTPAKDDPAFGFFKRPTRGELSSQ